MDDAGVTVIRPSRDALIGYLNPVAMTMDLWSHRHLIWQVAWRDVTGRYKGSRLGLLWSVGNPLMMLAIYIFVFGVIFKSRWDSGPDGTRAGYAITMFCGLSVFNLFSECVIRSPQLVVTNANYVKRVVFPLQALVAATTMSALLLAAINIAILVAVVAMQDGLFWTAACFPLALVPVLLLGLGCGWLAASLGVFMRDVGQIIAILLQMLFFATPIFYPLSAVPASMRPILRLNPLLHVLDCARATLLWGRWPDWPRLLGVTLLAAAAAQLGYAWFMKTKKGFADVL